MASLTYKASLTLADGQCVRFSFNIAPGDSDQDIDHKANQALVYALARSGAVFRYGNKEGE